MRKLVFFRGPSGSGKSTAAQAFVAKHGGAYFEADSYFFQNGKYVFDTEKLGQAHGDCQRRVREYMLNNLGPIVISNTSMRRWEMNPYLQMAAELGYEVEIYRIKGPWIAEVFAARNLHGVSPDIVQRQIDKYQPMENEIEYVE